jgi:hypothetical protein
MPSPFLAIIIHVVVVDESNSYFSPTFSCALASAARISTTATTTTIEHFLSACFGSCFFRFTLDCGISLNRKFKRKKELNADTSEKLSIFMTLKFQSRRKYLFTN